MPRPRPFSKHTMNISTYINEAVEELNHVRWPTRQQALKLSGIVLGFLFVTTIAFGGVDYMLSEGVTLLLSLT